MIKRYSTKEMEAIWNDNSKFDSWLKVEILASEAWNKLGTVPDTDLELIKEKAKFDVNRIYEIEQSTRHDVIAFTRTVSESLGYEKKWIHYGLTSTDVVDTALGYQISLANELIEAELYTFANSLKTMSEKHKYSPCIGRTHGIHAEITTFGLKVALWYDELQRNIKRFKEARRIIECGKISGAVGTFGNTPPFVQDYVCLNLNINSANISTQILQRDRHAQYMATLAMIASQIEKIGTEIRHLQRTEVNEVKEGFAKGQKGSSAMPHKRNPIGSENMAGCARVIRGYMVTAYENINLWHERDISHSSAERIIIPDGTTLLHYMLKRFTNILNNLEINEQQMLDNIYKTHGAVFSGQVLNALVAKGLSREEAYDIVQPVALKSYKDGQDFHTLLSITTAVTNIMNPKELANCFDITHHLKEVDTIFKRVYTNSRNR
ncbi:adenylosuccinate lyase [Mycoplasma sp. P36-A1]|uniref:adenylosuccinate lyase n=1 Tax=Mycoplasma sp. P36-A1 TaxID=3252900 RepID=UPI003C2F90D1